MKVGTADPISDSEHTRPEGERRSRLFGGSSGRGDGKDGGGGGDNGGGGDRPHPDDSTRSGGVAGDKAKFVTWFLLLVVLMTFGGMLGAYIVISTNGAAEWRPFDLPPQVWISTILILLSSVTYQIAHSSFFAGRYATTRKMLIVTTVLGATFISSQLLVWLEMVNRGLYMRGNPYAGFFYILTAAHAVHVLGGIVALGAVLLRTWVDTEHEPELNYRRSLVRSVGWYWHFMGVLWIALFVMLGFWK
ncbi:MAG TPA: heme-copper oxidase subunit III [Pyrinomonadaceae bacterium]|nr:heme-copper oxidase subunit III [Pyrinomonadaceae bacterium]